MTDPDQILIRLAPRSIQHMLSGVLRFLTHSVLLRVLIFIAALYAVGESARPWKLGWLRMDEATEIAESFLTRQGAELQDYTLIRAVERRRHGMWSASGNEKLFGVDPAVGYLLRYFRPGMTDGWTVAVSPTGRIYRVQREQLDDEPGIRLDHSQAFELTLDKLAMELGVPAYTLTLLSDTMLFQPQRSDWTFEFAWPEALGDSGRLRITLASEAIAELSYTPQAPFENIVANRTARSSRVLGFALILAGVFLIMHYHRTPLALKAAGLWGAFGFVLTLAVRGMTFSQSVILMPSENPLTGYLARVALSAMIDALQTGLLIGLIVATGEALSRDVFRGATSLSRLASGINGWRAAWAQAARWALPAAAIMVILEAAATHVFGPVGLCGKVPGIIAGALSSPLPGFTLPAQIVLDTIWEESLYRLWLLSLLLFWLRLPVLAIPLAAGAAAFFAGFDVSQFLTVGGAFYLTWGLLAGFLMLRVGIIAAMLFHLLLLSGYAGLALFWTGFGTNAGILLIGILLLGVLIISRDRPSPPAPPPENGSRPASS
ncbi:hypothetical protein EHM69_02850 [candidate division KSB1 bacterium]|nr:MAG: hypothetical protein EHM69_02850 [candidate division KSB1 bacterium]